VHFVAANVDDSAGHGVEAAITGLRDVLVEESCGRDEDDEDEQESNDDAKPASEWCGTD
jgi:hypothetical protein